DPFPRDIGFHRFVRFLQFSPKCVRIVRKTMACHSCLSRLNAIYSFYLICVILVTFGFAYQTWFICSRYFKYQTTADLFMGQSEKDDLLPIPTYAPAVVFCITIGDMHRRKMAEKPISELFTDKTRVVETNILEGTPNSKRSRDGRLVTLKTFIQNGRYCISVKP